MFGWMGKILKVDLSNSKITNFSTQDYAHRFLGGRGLASRLYWETVTPATKAFDEENRLIFMTGPLMTTGVQGATRLAIIGKSPMAYPEGYCYGNMGGFVGPELKKAGYDGIVIEGRAQKPAYLLINDDQAELRDAAELWGQGAYRTGELLQKAHGEKIRFITTGVAGEKMVRTAVLLGSHQSTSCAGFGAVMGSKNLKAIAIAGSGKPTVAEPEKLKELNRYTINISKRVRLSIPPIITGSGHSGLLEVIGKGGCYQCGLECIRGYYRYGKKYEDFRHCQSMEYYLPWKYKQEEEPVETLFQAPTLANDYSIDTFELQSIIDWLYSCQKAGVLTEAETGLPLSKIGSLEFLEKLLHSIAYREGFGDILAEGLVRAGEKVSPQARALFGYAVAPIGQHDMGPPRAVIANGITYAMEPRVHQPLVHEISFVMAAWNMNRAQPGSTPVTTRLFHDIARVFWGSEAAGDLCTYEGKALAAKSIQDHTYIKDSLSMCDYAIPLTYSFTTPDHMGDPDLAGKLFNAVTGRDGNELQAFAERIFNQQRAILLREGRQVPEADYPPEFNFKEPLKTNARGQPMMVPGPGDSEVSATGNILDRKKYQKILEEYYQLRGWDEKTGIPERATLERLGLGDIFIHG